MEDQHQRYYSFMLRLWNSGSEVRPVWRASLESPHTGERLTFATLKRLFDFLEDQCDQAGSPDVPAGGDQE